LCTAKLQENKGIRMIAHRLGVAHIYYCIPVFLQFHQIELITKRQLDKENKRKKKKMENEMLKRAREKRLSKHANTHLIIKVTGLTKPRQLLQMDNIKYQKQICMQTINVTFLPTMDPKIVH
jgi:hypothetical protein